MNRPVLGVDVGGTSIKWVTTGADGTVVDSGRTTTPQDGPDSVTQRIRELRADLDGSIDGRVFGVTLPGHFDRRVGVTTLLPNVPGEWAGYPFRKRLGGHGSVELVNDARAFAIAELAVGQARQLPRAVFATIGTGLGGAIAIDGAVLRNHDDAVGELGHTTVTIDGRLCGCGNRGCAEAYVGVLALERATGFAIDEVRACADAGDARVIETLQESARAFATAVGNSAVLLRAPVAVIGGGIGTRWPEYAIAVARILASRRNLLGPTQVLISQLGDHAGAIGASVAARQISLRPPKDEKGTP